MSRISGLNIQWPWSELILSGEKTIETRTYPLPEKHLKHPLALIETPGPRGKKNSIFQAQIKGVIWISGCKRYNNKKDFYDDSELHKVYENDPQFFFDEKKEKWGWVIEKIETFKTPMPPPEKRGIVFATNCQVKKLYKSL